MASVPKPCCLIAVFFLLFSKLSAQPGQYLFQHLTIEDGLPFNSVNCSLQDQEGFLWFGTSDGMVRYDGKNLRIFNHDTDNDRSISNNFIDALYEDKWGYIWIGTTGGGLNRFDPGTETFVAFQHQPGNENSLPGNFVKCLIEDDLGQLWVGTDKGLSKITLSPGPDRQPIYYQNFRRGFNALSDPQVNVLFQDKKRNIWVGTNYGLNRFPPPSAGDDRQEIPIQQFLPDSSNAFTLKDGIIHTIFQSHNGDLWVGTGHSLEKLTILPNGELSFRSFLKGKIPPTPVTSIEEAPIGQLWIGLFETGLLYFNYTNTTDLKLNTLQHDPANRKSINSNKIFEIYKDRNGLFWLGLEEGGLSYFDPTPQAFGHMGAQSLSNPLSGNTIISIQEDHEGLVWVGTERDGLSQLNRTNGELKVFKTGYPHLYSNLITALHEDQSGNLWIGSFRGVNVWTKEDRLTSDLPNFKHYRALPDSDEGLSDRRIFAIHEYPKGVYWIGTRGQGLNRLVFKDGDWSQPSFIHYKHIPDNANSLSDNYVWSIRHDAQGHLWVGTDQGINKVKLNAQSEAISFLAFRNHSGQLNSLSADLVGPILCSRDSIIWVGTTGGGLNKLDFRQDPGFVQPHITRFTTADGLPDDNIYGILEDQKGFLWLSTNRGLCRFDPHFTPKAGQQPQDAFTKFYAKDGLQGNEFNTNAYFKSKNGELFFGGMNGITHFFPDSLNYGEKPPPIVFTDFRIFNQSISNATKNTPLQQAINQTRHLLLSYKDDMIGFEFAALDFQQPSQNQYAYKLEGYNEHWIYLGKENIVHFTNLDPGQYRLVVKGSNSRGIWNHEGAAIDFFIAPPPWKSWWAYLIYTALFAGLVYTFIQYRIGQGLRAIEEENRLSRARFEEREMLRKQNAADYHDELGHRLTKISLFLELAQRQTNSNTPLNGYLSKIKSNTQDLSDGIRDLIWSLDPSKDTLYQTLLRLQAFGDKLFDYSDTAFQTKGIAEAYENIQLGADQRRHLLLLFKEAMHNCLKYAQASLAKLDIEHKDEQIEIVFQDNGQGFDPTKVNTGYGLKNMEERAQKIGGELAITTVENEGTRVALRISPIKK